MRATELLGGRYELRGVLGRGGMAVVHDGWDTRLDRAVAVKLLHPVLRTNTENRMRFDAEAKSAASLNHPNIVAVHDSGEYDGTPYIVMERLPGRSLADLIERGPVSQPMVHMTLDHVLAALAVAHEAGILHRDIKPGNILFGQSGEAKVADFGIAKSAGTDYTATGQIVGTMAYLSPERIAGRSASFADDLYALGVVGYEALAGRRAFVQENPGALARAIMDEPLPPISLLRPDVGPQLAGVIDRAITRDPSQRFASAREMRAALAGRITPPMTAGLRPPTRVLDAPLPPPSMLAVPPRTQLRKNRKVLLAAAGLVALAVAAGAFALDSESSRSVPQSPAVTSTTLAPPPTSSSPIPSSLTPSPVDQPGPPPKKHGPKGGRGNGGDG
jgi:serine/threonine protein kinase